jgi:hypothetical protein
MLTQAQFTRAGTVLPRCSSLLHLGVQRDGSRSRTFSTVTYDAVDTQLFHTAAIVANLGDHEQSRRLCCASGAHKLK